MYLSIVKVLVILILKNVVCQVCNKTISIFREFPETYRFSYIETYEEPCVVFCSVKTRLAVNVTTRIVQRYENVTVNTCCEGYVENNKHEGDGFYCEPICNLPCQNGYCRRPNECACNVGYAFDPLNVCQPLCLKDCYMPHCITTKNLQCFSEDTEPLYTEPSINGTFIAPGVCECGEGHYAKSPNVCEPGNSNCSCTSDRSDCDPGWQWKCGSCQPICFECEHGTCISPDGCECNHGYIKSARGKCEPHCATGCTNGRCVSPDICSCNPGWYMVEDNGECIAHCDMKCDNGDCVAPNICECYSGYQIDRSMEEPRCVPGSKECESSSITVDTCECTTPYEVRYSTDDGGDCDCFAHCTDSSKECTKATCLFKNNVDDTTPIVDSEKTILISDTNKTPFQMYATSTISSTTVKGYNGDTPSNSSNAFTNLNVLELPASIYGIISVAVLIALLIIGFIVKRKCFEKQAFNSPDKNDDIIVHYINKLSSHENINQINNIS